VYTKVGKFERMGVMEEEPKSRQNIEVNSERISNLNKALGFLDEKSGIHIGNAIYELEKAAMVDLIPNLVRVELDYFLKILLKHGENSDTFAYATSGSYEHIAGKLPRYYAKGILPNDYEYAEVGNAFLGIMAATKVDEGHFPQARYWYERAGMTEKAEEFKEFEPEALAFDDVSRPYKGWPRMQAELKEASKT